MAMSSGGRKSKNSFRISRRSVGCPVLMVEVVGVHQYETAMIGHCPLERENSNIRGVRWYPYTADVLQGFGEPEGDMSKMICDVINEGLNRVPDYVMVCVYCRTNNELNYGKERKYASIRGKAAGRSCGCSFRVCR